MSVLRVATPLQPADLSVAGGQVVQLAFGLRQAGHEVEILGRGSGGLRAWKLLFPITVVGPVLRAVRSFRPDVVQVHESDGGLAVLFGNIAERGCIVKTSGVDASILTFSGPARIFESQDAAVDASSTTAFRR